MKKTIKIWIFPQEFETGDYGNIYDCALSKALKREKIHFSSVGGTSVDIDGERYFMDRETSNTIRSKTGLKNQDALLVYLSKEIEPENDLLLEA